MRKKNFQHTPNTLICSRHGLVSCKLITKLVSPIATSICASSNIATHVWLNVVPVSQCSCMIYSVYTQCAATSDESRSGKSVHQGWVVSADVPSLG